MNNSYIISGSLFGDEGKGTFVDYLSYTKNIKENVRYNGGSQASHTVINDGITHKFSQLGSHFLNEDSRTFLSRYTIVNLFNIIVEADYLERKINIPREELLKRVFVDSSSIIVTPYHKLINELNEIENQNNRRGSVGTGVSEVIRVYEQEGVLLSLNDFTNEEYIKKLHELFNITKSLLSTSTNKKLINKLITKEDIECLTNDKNKDYIIKCYENLLNSGLINIIEDITRFHQKEDVLFEGSQGLLIDKDYGIRPNTTLLSTSNKNGILLSNTINTTPHKIGIISSLISRHGIGVLPTYDKTLSSMISDENQKESYYQGFPRYGYFDAILLRYSQSINNNDEYFLSSLDRLSSFKEIKICDSYIYTGEITDDFKETFDYYIDNNRTIIKNIKKNSIYLRKYLSKTIPLYIVIDGWNKNISNITNIEDLPDECHNFINLIEYLTNIKITLLSVGPNRNQKLERILR